VCSYPLLPCEFPRFYVAIVQGFAMLFSCAAIRDLLLSSLFNGLFLCSTIREPIFRRQKAADIPVTL
jgi:hypothetical protein